jgi:2-oxoglutarate ferredoxin oxidoreductase subunit beta
MRIEDLQTRVKPQWCPGCGNFGILQAWKQALVELGIPQEQVVFSSGIGCSGKIPHYIQTYGIETLHGRSLPVAEAVHLANHDLTVIAEGGDGDGYGLGMGHFMHLMRRNINLTYVVHDNMIYGLTKGQTSPTSRLGFVSKTTPWGQDEQPVRPLLLAVTGGATYVARGYSAKLPQLVQLFKGAIQHRGFAFVDVFQPCVSFNRENTWAWFNKHAYVLEEKEPEYDPTNLEAALRKAYEWPTEQGGGLPLGLIYKVDRPPLEDGIPSLQEGPLATRGLEGIDVTCIYDDFR